ncbi:unnamed protein product [Prorocentrum cordatum]|uniref:Subtilisin n=1 Tax=Prorocentrum cordatum TaxID=2364126 RepID=A0ABN9T4A3_9DINO|nr:unnamed protein product [Polarella glacialis]
MARARGRGGPALLALAAGALLACRAALPTAFAGLPLREAALAGALLAGDVGGATDPARAPVAYDLGGSSIPGGPRGGDVRRDDD